ncbi:hypothetical protein ACQPYK_21635 [Streptosporangium sp. CA-135522]|uniref:hypothetical protein n=1 Tax=Streptosporangium sp. CA-135522 TaxID=3240072 RepID=UPI003D8EA679
MMVGASRRGVHWLILCEKRVNASLLFRISTSTAIVRTPILGMRQASEYIPRPCEGPLDLFTNDGRGHHVDAGRFSADEVYEHYRRLVREPELDVALSWTVVLPDDGVDPLTLQEVSTRLGGGTSYELHQTARPHIVNLPLPLPGPCAVVDQLGTATVLYGPGCLSLSGVLQRLSPNARVYNAWWNANSVNYLSLAVDGEVLLAIDGLFPCRPEDHPNLTRWPELAAMEDFFVDVVDQDCLGRDDGWNWKAGFLTAVELATGVRLDRGWLDGEHPYLTFSGPIPG